MTYQDDTRIGPHIEADIEEIIMNKYLSWTWHWTKGEKGGNLSE